MTPTTSKPRCVFPAKSGGRLSCLEALRTYERVTPAQEQVVAGVLARILAPSKLPGTPYCLRENMEDGAAVGGGGWEMAEED